MIYKIQGSNTQKKCEMKDKNKLFVVRAPHYKSISDNRNRDGNQI